MRQFTLPLFCKVRAPKSPDCQESWLPYLPRPGGPGGASGRRGGLGGRILGLVLVRETA